MLATAEGRLLRCAVPMVSAAAPVASFGALSLGAASASASASGSAAAAQRPAPPVDSDDDDDDDDEPRTAHPAASLPHGADLQHETTVKAGYLYKKGEKRKTWKKRWFVLRSSRLAYYKNDKEYQLLRLIDMADVHTVTAVELKRNQNGFGIVTPKRTFYIKAADHADMLDWIAKLNNVKRVMAEQSTDEGFDHDLYDDLAHAHAGPTAVPAPVPSGATGHHPLPSPGRADALAPGPGRSQLPPPGSLGRSPVTSDSEASGLGYYGSQHASPEIGSAPRFPPMGDRLAPNLPPVSTPAVLSSSEDDWNEDEIPPAQTLPHGMHRSADPVLSESPPRPNPPASSEAIAAFLRDPARVLLQGYLLKQSARRKVWRKRWFVLTSSQLLWAGSHMDTRTNRRLTVADMVDAIEYEPSSTPGPSGTTAGALSISTLAHPHRREAVGSPNAFSPTSLGSPDRTEEYTAPTPHSTLGFLERRSSIMNGISQGAASAIGASNKKRQENCFRVITPKRTLLLCAPSEEEEIKWLSTLQTLISRVRDARAQEQRQKRAV